MAYNAADEEQVNERGRKEKRGRELQLEDMGKLLRQPEFRRFVWRYLSDSHVFKSVFNSHGGLMNLNEGQRQVGLKMLADVMETDPNAYVTMLMEAKQDADA